MMTHAITVIKAAMNFVEKTPAPTVNSVNNYKATPGLVCLINDVKMSYWQH